MKKRYLTLLLVFGTYALFAQPAVGCFELIEAGEDLVEVRFNVGSISANSNEGANNRISRGEISLSWTGPGTLAGFTNSEYNWFNDGSTSNSIQFRFGPINQATTFTEGESILLLSFSISGGAGTITINSSDLINLINQDLASDNSCPTSYDFALLPVELSSFTAEVVKAKQTQLRWHTASEIENDYFAVEHSLDGSTFTEIGRLEGVGTSTEGNAYAFMHDFPGNGDNYYRLRQVDFDGSTTYSDLRSVWINSTEIQVKAFPNPTTDLLNLQLSNNLNGTTIQLVDQSGRKLITQKIEANTLRTTIKVGYFSRGAYWLHLLNEGRLSSQKIVLH